MSSCTVQLRWKAIYVFTSAINAFINHKFTWFQRFYRRCFAKSSLYFKNLNQTYCLVNLFYRRASPTFLYPYVLLYYSSQLSLAAVAGGPSLYHALITSAKTTYNFLNQSHDLANLFYQHAPPTFLVP